MLKYNKESLLNDLYSDLDYMACNSPLEGQILTLLETLGLEKTQAKAIKDLTRKFCRENRNYQTDRAMDIFRKTSNSLKELGIEKSKHEDKDGSISCFGQLHNYGPMPE
jgi:hypothetical protein